MPRKQVGAIDADLLAEVDKRAEWLGQTRRVFIERTLHQRLANPDWKVSSGGSVDAQGRVALPVTNLANDDYEPPSRTSGPKATEQALSVADQEPSGPGDASSREEAAPAERPDERTDLHPGAVRLPPHRQAPSSSQAKRDVRPVPKGGKS